MKYNEIFKSRRIAKGLTQQEVADKCKVSLMTVSSAEQPYAKCKQVPSEKYIKKFAREMGGSHGDIIELERNLMIERALRIIPQSVQGIFRNLIENASTGLCVEGEMPATFREIVQNDWASAQKKHRKIPEKDQAVIKDTIDNKLFLPRNDIIKMAKLLDGDINRYLLAAEYLTDDLHTLLQRHPFGADFPAKLNRMPQKDLDLFMNIFTYAVNCYMKAYSHKILDYEPN